MKEKKKAIIWLLIVAFLIIIFFVFVRPLLGGSSKKVTDPKKIEWLDTRNDQIEADVKKMLAEAVEKTEGKRPEKVVFLVKIQNLQLAFYHLETYYLLDGQWYERVDEWLSSFISPEMDAEIMRIIYK